MIFIGYEPGSKGYQFWDAAHHHIEISHDVKFDENLFPEEEAMKSWASQTDPPISESDNESDNGGLDLVIPAQSSPRPPSPGQSTLKPSGSQMQTHLNPPIASPAVQLGSQSSRSGKLPAQPEPPTPQYSLCPTKE